MQHPHVRFVIYDTSDPSQPRKSVVSTPLRRSPAPSPAPAAGAQSSGRAGVADAAGSTEEEGASKPPRAPTAAQRAADALAIATTLARTSVGKTGGAG